MIQNTNKYGLFIVGAGPGDPDLLTIKALNILKRADIVLFDNLINKTLLGYTPEKCLSIYVGKKPYGKYTPQEEINTLILKYASPKKVLIRLKGGDPFIFGRGFEEFIFAKENNIAVQYIPGITSMQAIGLNNIPLTHRAVSESIWVVTGTRKSDVLSKDLKLAMKSSATVIIYMGMKKLHEIVTAYREEGLENTPIAIIQHASLPQEKKVVCTIKSVEKEVAEIGLTHPAIIAIGKVIHLMKPFNS